MSSSEPPYARLTPDRMLDALESVGLRGDGRFIALNSYENRVYQVSLEDGRTLVAKFYRPGRWSDAEYGGYVWCLNWAYATSGEHPDGERLTELYVSPVTPGGAATKVLSDPSYKPYGAAFRPGSSLRLTFDGVHWYQDASGVDRIECGLFEIALTPGADAAADSLSLEELRALATGSPTARFDRLFVADPNLGLWDAARSQLGIASMEQPRQVIFLENEAAVLGAVAADPRAAGLASSLSLPRDLASLGTRALALRPDAAGPAADPGYEEIAYGEYPLHHHLLAACRARGSIQGTMFVTHLTSDRGQRQVERAGFLPARQTLREVVITRDPIGKTG